MIDTSLLGEHVSACMKTKCIKSQSLAEIKENARFTCILQRRNEQANIMSFVCLVLRKRQEDAESIEHVLTCTHRFISHSHFTALDNEEIVLLLKAMKLHCSNVRMMKISCALLASLVLNYRNQWAVVDAGGLDLLVAVIKEHVTNPELMETAYEALSHILCEYIDVNEFVKIDGMSALLLTIQMHYNNASVMHKVYGLMEILVVNGVNIKTLHP